MNQNTFKNLYNTFHYKKHLLDSSFCMNDFILENNEMQSFHLDDNINECRNFQSKETELNETNNLELNYFKLLSDTTKNIVEAKNVIKKDIALDIGKADCKYKVNNYIDNNNDNKNLLEKESFKVFCRNFLIYLIVLSDLYS